MEPPMVSKEYLEYAVQNAAQPFWENPEEEYDEDETYPTANRGEPLRWFLAYSANKIAPPSRG